ncbi:hypothetical protein [Nannocystis radixulma]|uniref:Lipoprotein n=1 Tax=Nannocystis radixulma TaxID=2995305 RepID=A0ABT5BAK9_9BACT|nr:hypothetical protein [Nannocystis radixulma]MDC0670072.1 hypothetical protein [Nannocystis radixulma]
MHITTRIELGILLSALLACSFKAELSASDTYTAGDPGTGDSESSSPGTDGATTTSAGPGGDSHWSGTATMHPVPDGETTGTTAAEPGNGTDTTWAGTTLVETGTTGDASDTWAGTTLEPDPGTDTHVTTTPYTTGEPAPCEGEAVPIEAEVLSYVESQIDASPDSDGTTGDVFDPNMVYVRFSDQTFTCADPHDRLACGHHWELSLRLPTAFQKPGLYTLDFVDGVPHGFGLQTGAGVGSDDCDGGGSVAKGMIQVIAIDEDKVVGRLCHVTWSGLDNDFALDGSFIAPRCPQ